MSFINLGTWELVLIVIIAILAVGPQRLVQVVRTIQKWTGQARQISRQLMSSLQTELDAVEDLKGTAQEAVQAVKEIQQGVTETVAAVSSDGEALTDTAEEASAALKGLKKDLAAMTKPPKTEKKKQSPGADDKQPEGDQ